MGITLALPLQAVAIPIVDLEVSENIVVVRENTGCLLFNGANGGGEAMKLDIGERVLHQMALLPLEVPVFRIQNLC